MKVVVGAMMSGPGRSSTRRAAEEMLRQVELDVARLTAAFAATGSPGAANTPLA